MQTRLSLLEGTVAALEIPVSDPDGDDLSLAVDNFPSGFLCVSNARHVDCYLRRTPCCSCLIAIFDVGGWYWIPFAVMEC